MSRSTPPPSNQTSNSSGTAPRNWPAASLFQGRRPDTPCSRAPASRSGNARTPLTPTPEYANNLRSDGRLKDNKRERRVRLNLCLYCGESGHGVNACPKRPPPSPGTPARASPSASNAPRTPSTPRARATVTFHPDTSSDPPAAPSQGNSKAT